MKRIFIAGMLLLGGWAHAALYNQTFSGGTVTGGNPAGMPFTGNFNMDPNSDTVFGITVDLNVSGGYSGGFYVSLTGPDGSTTVILLNQPGTDTEGLNIRLQDGATAINSGSDLSLGTSSPYAAFGTLSGFSGQSVNGAWTLYFADTTSGESPTLTSWTLNIDAVPEPITYALAVFGLMFVGIGAGRYFLARRRSTNAS
jgi:hypothetical protein